MKYLTAVELRCTLAEIFPQFELEFDEEDADLTLHGVVIRLAPVVTGYLQAAQDQTRKRFCTLIDAMVGAGGDPENAISTCLLEHATQLRCKKILKEHLGVTAKRELR